ncbi:Transcription regulator, LysR family [Lactobacillus plantarum ZJ316] [Lactiplantibacillus mudanjiangensis]|nr:Transcription regulator, LysR family [Lactobacillus plantarum ZJ316] [Lactiplantibacillus mudanjiangensis]
MTAQEDLIMDINRLQTFLQVAQYGSFKQVADQQFRSQRTISKQITQLEAELGVKLVVRSANQIELTAQGQFFRSAAQDIVNSYSHAVNALTTFDAQATQKLRLGYFSAFEGTLLQTALFHLLQQQPTLQVTLQEASNEHLTENLLQGNLDAALSINYGQPALTPHSPLSATVIYENTMLMGVSRLNPLSQQDQLSPTDLTQRPILYYSPESSDFLGRGFRASLAAMAVNTPIQRVTSSEQMQLLVALNQAYAFYPAGLVTPTDEIKLMPLDDARAQHYQIVLLTDPNNHNPALPLLHQSLATH